MYSPVEECTGKSTSATSFNTHCSVSYSFGPLIWRKFWSVHFSVTKKLSVVEQYEH